MMNDDENFMGYKFQPDLSLYDLASLFNNTISSSFPSSLALISPPPSSYHLLI
jgi:hypothetical protein